MFTKEKTVYVAIPSYGLIGDLWNNEAYLKELVEVAQSRAWIAEATEAVRLLRDKADNAETPAELKGYNAAVNIVKKLLLLPPAAKAKIERLKYDKEIQEQTDKSNQP